MSINNELKNIILVGVRFNPMAVLGLVDSKSFQSHGIQITHLDLTPWMNPVDKPFPVKKINEEQICYDEIFEKNNLIGRISDFNPENTLVIFGGWWSVYLQKIEPIFRQRDFKTLLFNLNPVTHYDPYGFLKLQLKNLLTNKQKSLPDYCICEGRYKQRLFKAMGYRDIWSFHSRDYERFIKINSQQGSSIEKKEKDYILYIDQDFLNHRDFKMFNVKVEGILAYFETLREQLTQLAQCLNKKVVFALHPSADKEAYQKLFPEFEMQWGDTFSLLPDAGLVIGHFSNALDMAVLFDKRIILLDVPANISNHLHKSCKEFAKRIKGKFISINELSAKAERGFVSVNKKQYNQYIRYLINANHPSDETFSEQFFRHINEGTRFTTEINSPGTDV